METNETTSSYSNAINVGTYNASSTIGNADYTANAGSNNAVNKDEYWTKNLTAEQLKNKLDFLIEQLKKFHAEIPDDFKTAIKPELLNRLANCLMNDTIFDIVKGLLDIQHATEKHLQQQREQVEIEYQRDVQQWIEKIQDPEELEHILALCKLQHTKKLRETDCKIISVFEQKVQDQQTTLQNAGVVGFHPTDNLKEIEIQMYLLKFILRLNAMKNEMQK